MEMGFSIDLYIVLITFIFLVARTPIAAMVDEGI